MRDGVAPQLEPADKAASVGALIDWYVETVVVERGGGGVAEAMAARKTARRVVKHLLAGTGRDEQTLLYAVDYSDDDGVAFESRLVLLSPNSPYAVLD
jgi:hypothetical protein